MGPKSSLGWILLIAVLAVPAVLFWNWWTKMQSSSRSDPSRIASNPTPFAPSPAPVAAPTAPGAAPTAPAAAAPATAGAAPAPAASAPAGPGPQVAASAPAPSPGPGAQAAAAGVTSAPGPLLASLPPSAAPAGANVIQYAPASTRDPTMSHLDYAALAEEAAAREAAQRRIRDELAPKPRITRPAPEMDLGGKLEMQGVVATPNGMMALVNGESLREGDQIYGCVIKTITTRYVTFRCGGRSFSKKVE